MTDKCFTCGQQVATLAQQSEEDLRRQGVPETVIKAAMEQSEAIRKAMAPPGDLGLPPLLDKRRLEYGIPDFCFSREATFHRILVWQLPPEDMTEGFLGDTSIVAPDVMLDREQKAAPRGIVVSAGLRALDELRSNGVDLGHIVTFLRIVPWRLRVGILNAKRVELLILNAGDVVASTDLRANIRAGAVKVVQETIDGTPTHTYAGHGVPVDAALPGQDQ